MKISVRVFEKGKAKKKKQMSAENGENIMGSHHNK